ncbi:hypothetical protein [Aquisalimonas sp.]|uniref:hypothetical protein n=1 Tax=unclassified Aquisalimonas TaxID=2644645 RepID=UPI0025C628A2|nr:hypothetical protein [Aquisalimonas sp.]
MIRRISMLFMLAVALLIGQSAHADEPEHLLTVVNSGSNETQAMAMILTAQYLEQGGSAQVLLCDSAGELALEGSDMGSGVVQPADASPRQMLGNLIEAGVEVQVCAIFLPGQDKTEDDLIEGVTVARPDAIARTMAQRDTKLFTN